MNKKDYILISDVFAAEAVVTRIGPFSDAEALHRSELLASLAVSFADKLEKDNPRFSRGLFLQACGVKGAE